MQIADGVFTYRGRGGDKIRPGAGSSTVTVVRGDYLAMIDTGVTPGGAFDDLTSRMKADGLDPRDVRLILFTMPTGTTSMPRRGLSPVRAQRRRPTHREIPFIETAAEILTPSYRALPNSQRKSSPFPFRSPGSSSAMPGAASPI